MLYIIRVIIMVYMRNNPLKSILCIVFHSCFDIQAMRKRRRFWKYELSIRTLQYSENWLKLKFQALGFKHTKYRSAFLNFLFLILTYLYIFNFVIRCNVFQTFQFSINITTVKWLFDILKPTFTQHHYFLLICATLQTRYNCRKIFKNVYDGTHCTL